MYNYKKSGRVSVSSLGGLEHEDSDAPISPHGFLSAEAFWQAPPTATPMSTPTASAGPTRPQPQKTAQERQHAAQRAADALKVAKTFMLTRPISFEDFSVEIVPAVRTELTEVRHDTHFSEFMRVLQGNRMAHAVNLSLVQFATLSQRLGIEKEVFQECVDALPELSEPEQSSSDEEQAGDNACRLTKVIKARKIITNKNAEDSRLSFENVHHLLVTMEEKQEYQSRRKEWEIKKKATISEEKFTEHRYELIKLFDFFTLYDVDHSDALSHDEVRLLLKHLGMDPFRTNCAPFVQEVLESVDPGSKDSISFGSFLDLMAKVRLHQKMAKAADLKRHFLTSSDQNGRVDIDMVEPVLTASGAVAKTRLEIELQRQIIYDWDIETSGDVTFDTFLDIRQRVQEELFCHKMDEVVKYAHTLGIETARLSEYLWAFDHYDKDHNGSLSIEEIFHALHFITHNPPAIEELKKIYEQCGLKTDTEVLLEQYLQISQLACEGRGSWAEGTEFAFRLRDVPVQKLREILSFFPLSPDYINTLEVDDMVGLLSCYLDVDPESDLRQGLTKPVENTRQLIQYCKRIAHLLREAAGEDLPSKTTDEVKESLQKFVQQA
jgi:Ca2+-binding EF-hand superfamily protein